MALLTVKQAIEKHRLDKRFKYTEFLGELIHNETVTTECSDCYGVGCAECGGTGKRRVNYPVAVINPKTRCPIRVRPHKGWVRITNV